MKRLALALSLLATPALAQTPPINLTPSSGQTIVGPTIIGNTTITGPVSYPTSTGYAQATAAIAALQGAGL